MVKKSSKNVEPKNKTSLTRKERGLLAIKEYLVAKKETRSVDYHFLSDPFSEIGVIPTPIASLNKALMIGGFPIGRCTMIHGPESSGKTSLALATICSHLKKNSDAQALVVDMENALDDSLFKLMGIDVNDPEDDVAKRILIVQPINGDIAADLILQMTKSSLFDIILLDSIDSCQIGLGENKEKDLTQENRTGGLGRLMSKFYREMATAVRKSSTTFLAINQERDNLDRFSSQKIALPGGRAPKFYSSIIMRVQRIGDIKEGEEVIGINLKSKISKNKHAAPRKIAEYSFYSEKGFDRTREVIDIAIDAGIIYKETETAKKLRYKDQFLFKKGFFEFFDNNPQELEELEQLLFGETELEEEHIDNLDDVQ